MGDFIDIVETVSRFSETEKLLKRKAELTLEVKKIRRRLRTKKTQYAFLKTIIETNDANTQELAMRAYFLSIGYKKVIHIGRGFEREDLQIWYGKKVYIIECKNFKTSNAGRKDIGQLDWRKHHIKDLLEFKGYTLKYIMVLNNQYDFPPDKRDSNPLSEAVKTKLIADKNGLVTTMELYRAFIKMKSKKLTFTQFNKKLNQVGLIEF